MGSQTNDPRPRSWPAGKFDSVELVIRVENTFGIELPENELEQIKTPRDLIELVCHRLDLSDGPQCQSQQAFYRLRKGLMEVLGVSRDQVRLETRLADLAPVDDCRPWWLRLRENIGARDWPELVRPKWVERTIGGMTVVILIVSILGLWKSKGLESLGSSVLLGVLIAAAASSLMYRCTRRFILSLPTKVTRISDLIPASLSAPGIIWTRDGVETNIKTIIVDHLGIPPAEYSISKRFVEDYGVN
jgi:acyl carrier protein